MGHKDQAVTWTGGHPALREYATIGDGRTCRPDGSIYWLCVPLTVAPSERGLAEW
jgi:hypothetical protein